MIFDIEVEVTEGFPDIQKADNRITAIGFNDPLTDEYFCYVLDTKHKLKLDNTKENETVKSFTDEYDLLNAFFMKYLEIKPTILTGWNVEFFDIPYLYNRACKIVGQNTAELLSPIRTVKWSDFGNGKYKIAGVSVLDYLQLYKKFTFSERSSYRLDDIGKFEVGEKKVAYEGTLNDLYENDLEKFVEYNIQDVKLIKKLDDKLDFIEIARGIAHLGHIPYENVFMSSRYLEGAILVYLKKQGIIAPNKPKKPNKISDDKFVGAYVQEPQKGKHNWVFDLDITSMYPSCIMSLNISPETKIGKLEGWNPEEFIRGVNKTYTVTNNETELGRFTNIELKDYLENRSIGVATNGVMYRTDKDGLLPALLRKWFDDRVEYRKLSKKFHEDGDKDQSDYFDRRQYLQKILLNSLYGVLGLPVFRFYDLDNAEAVTYTGQSLIKFTKKIANNFYNKELGDDKDHCIYIDTDSVFYSATPLVQNRFPNVSTTDEEKMSKAILNIADEVQLYLNNSYNYFGKRFCNLDKHRFDIKQEVIAKSGLFVTKKRYGLKIINDNGKKVNKLMVKGLDTVRSSFPIAMREMLSKLLEDILMDVPKEQLDKFILNFKNSMKLMDFDKIAIPTGVKKVTKYEVKGGAIFKSYKLGTPVHVKSALFYNDMLKHLKISRRYTPIYNGEKIKWVYLKNNPMGLETIGYKGHEDPPEIISFIKEFINPNKLYKQALHKKIMMFYEALGWNEPTDATKTMERFF
jgi:DNA polymerase elongation subunit (family B)